MMGMSHHELRGILLLHLGSPKSTSVHDVRDYLREFLSDPYVIDIPALNRWLLLNLVILPTRPKKTAAAYKKIWRTDGSPLIVHTRNLASSLSVALDHRHVVRWSTRYGDPKATLALEEFRNLGIRHITAIPLHPQYSWAATETAIQEVNTLIREKYSEMNVEWIPHFYSKPEFINTVANKISATITAAKPDALLLSYHGVPERQVRRVEKSPGFCQFGSCCEAMQEGNSLCYRAQCFETSRLIAKRISHSANFPAEKIITAFQSRLGRTPWILPHTDALLTELPKKGIKKLLVASPSFVTDCLETLEEIEMRYRDLFLAAGGESFQYVPCLNSDAEWVNGLAKMLALPTNTPVS